MQTQTGRVRYLLCIRNRGYAAALERRKVYMVLEDAQAAEHGLVRVIDESGEDYLYPESFFVPVEIPKTAVRAFASAN